MFYQFEHIGFADYFKQEEKNDFSFPAHMHQCFEFVTILSGKMSVSIDNDKYELEKGESVLIFPNQIHMIESEKCHHYLCIFSPKLVSAYYSAHNGEKPKINKTMCDKQLLDNIINMPQNSDILYKKGILYLLCSSFDKNAEYKPTENNSFLEKIFKYISENFSSKCLLEDVSKEIGYNPSYISRQFKSSTNIGFSEYVNIYRLNHACYLLKNTNETILSCAMESGFNSVRTFNRNFKDVFNMLPSEYRNNSFA